MSLGPYTDNFIQKLDCLALIFAIQRKIPMGLLLKTSMYTDWYGDRERALYLILNPTLAERRRELDVRVASMDRVLLRGEELPERRAPKSSSWHHKVQAIRSRNCPLKSQASTIWEINSKFLTD
ncbi:hypothetical protein OnM2_089036 [Erysiphe neolycopersici]|uniref:Uncharacterized protein n=1 Tax=Erysiphe neolycopersici TaxID=212602 RepID=A0A420HD80_9PEZI|nr:hypothetical protein OnM2_089036 [Erysiphe neolycopersici]